MLSQTTARDARGGALSPKGWSPYECVRADQRHGRTCEISCDELIGFVTGLPLIVACSPGLTQLIAK
jgi:hypothetical protein